MGYYTSYRLKIFEAERHQLNLFETKVVTWSPEIEEAYSNHPGVDYAVDNTGKTYDQVKWYDYHDDMIAHSKKYPGLVFQLYGEGEESGDIWCEYFHNGKSVRHEAPEWEPPEFDPKQLT